MTKCRINSLSYKDSCFLCFKMQKAIIFLFLMQKKNKNICFTKKSCTFASHLSIGLWCNGNTTDSGPVILGSSPSSPT